MKIRKMNIDTHNTSDKGRRIYSGGEILTNYLNYMAMETMKA